MKNNIRSLIILTLVLLFCAELTTSAQNCPIYFPCQNGQLKYQSTIVKKGRVSIEEEDLSITSTGSGTIGFTRTIRVTVLGGQNYVSTTSGQISVQENNIAFPPEYYLPRPISIQDFFDPPVANYTGQNCLFPHTIVPGNLPECQEMKVLASRSKKLNPPGNKLGSLDASQSLDLRVSYPERVVLAVDQPLILNGSEFNCVIVKERYIYSGNFSGNHWEINWYAKGFGLIQSKYFKNNPGSNWNGAGDLGFKLLTSWSW